MKLGTPFFFPDANCDTNSNFEIKNKHIVVRRREARLNRCGHMDLKIEHNVSHSVTKFCTTQHC